MEDSNELLLFQLLSRADKREHYFGIFFFLIILYVCRVILPSTTSESARSPEISIGRGSLRDLKAALYLEARLGEFSVMSLRKLATCSRSTEAHARCE